MTKRLTAIVAATAILFAGCGGDDDASDDTGDTADASQAGADSADAASGAAEAGGADGIGDQDAQELQAAIDAGDVMGQLLPIVFGLSPSFLTEDERGCLNDEIASLFPDGIVPGDYALTDEAGDTIDAAAEACGVDLVN